MQRTSKTFPGDTPGLQWTLEVLTFNGTDPAAPSAYLQAALHGSEFPGVAALHYLIPMLQQAEADEALAGDVTIVPNANPIGMAQWINGEPQGRFELFSRTNFNRDHFRLNDFDTSSLPTLDAPIAADIRLKAELLRLALAHEIVLDLHCDDESEQYMYIHQDFWPAMKDLAVAIKCTSVLTWDLTADAAFEEAAANPVLATKADAPDYKRRAVTTIEFAGLADVSAEKGLADGKGLYEFLQARGTVKGKSQLDLGAFSGPVTPLENVEMVRSPIGGMVFYHVAPGDVVSEGQKLVTLVHEVGSPLAEVIVTAPQAGRILTRRHVRCVRRGDDLLKLLAAQPSKTAKPGSLES